MLVRVIPVGTIRVQPNPNPQNMVENGVFWKTIFHARALFGAYFTGQLRSNRARYQKSENIRLHRTFVGSKKVLRKIRLKPNPNPQNMVEKNKENVFCVLLDGNSITPVRDIKNLKTYSYTGLLGAPKRSYEPFV